MYAYTLATGGSSGLALLLAPSAASSLLNLPAQEPIIGGVVYSVWLACGILCISGLRSPLKFSPILLLDVAYKAIWLVAVVLPREAGGQLPAFAVIMSILYLTIIIGDLVAIPWRYLLAK